MIEPPLLSMLIEHGAHDVVGADQVDLDVARPDGGIGRGERRDRLDDAGIVDQDVEAAQPLAGIGHRALDRGIVGDIAGQRLGRAAGRDDLARHLLREVAVARQQHDRRVVAGQRPRHPFAQAAARAGHQCDFSLQAHRTSSATVGIITHGRKEWPARSDSSGSAPWAGPWPAISRSAGTPLVVHDIDAAKTAAV